jgi:hypothetical protein
METPSPVKRKATIDLTRSDSEEETPKRRRRVIEIESDDDEAVEAPAPASTMPWETPEWKAHCAKVRNAFGGFSYLNAIRASNGEPEIDTYGSDEEMWRKINDPVGHQRMFLTRLVAGKSDPLDPNFWTDYVERKVAKFARELEEKRRVDSEA